ncbi:uncharacterized protein LOC113561079 [Rhopalosiphum maidis]|uniref:uncharacterized protein LOC113561079 n=1 Tax=Rhopalosiphum maidis TaxID=43146 RepID=UPI000EFE573A|nr:uncharacterized protein LOC113561079 [Rhopalosiphum maidis]
MMDKHLVDFDWKLKYVMGSSSLSTLEEPLLQVILHLKDGPRSNNTENPKVSENVFLEFSQEELLLFIEKLKQSL